MYRYTIARGHVDRPSPYKVGTIRVTDDDYTDAMNRVEWLHKQGYCRVTVQTRDTLLDRWYEIKTSRRSQFA